MTPLNRFVVDKAGDLVLYWLDVRLCAESLLTMACRVSREAGHEGRLPTMSTARRREYLTARAVQRLALSDRTGIAPDRWVFTDSAAPGISAPEHPALWHSVSHGGSMVACLTSTAGPVGVDIEPLQSGPRLLALGEFVFSDAEGIALARAPDAARATMATRMWTLKEAYGKALGIGLAMEPIEMSFNLGCGRNGPRLVSPNAAHSWCFQELSLFPTAACAIAQRSAGVLPVSTPGSPNAASVATLPPTQ